MNVKMEGTVMMVNKYIKTELSIYIRFYELINAYIYFFIFDPLNNIWLFIEPSIKFWFWQFQSSIITDLRYISTEDLLYYHSVL